jgi:hypothetical protein
MYNSPLFNSYIAGKDYYPGRSQLYYQRETLKIVAHVGLGQIRAILQFFSIITVEVHKFMT